MPSSNLTILACSDTLQSKYLYSIVLKDLQNWRNWQKRVGRDGTSNGAYSQVEVRLGAHTSWYTDNDFDSFYYLPFHKTATS